MTEPVQAENERFTIVHDILTPGLGRIPLTQGEFGLLPQKVQRFIAEKAQIMRPRGIHVCDGSYHEAQQIAHKLMEEGMLSVLQKYENKDTTFFKYFVTYKLWIIPKTWIVTCDKNDAVANTLDGIEPVMGHWMSPDRFEAEIEERFPLCCTGRMMYVIPFSMCPIGSPFSKIGIQLTDSMYVVLCMRLLTWVSSAVFDALGDADFVKCIHSVGIPRPVKQRLINNWPCNPEKIMVALRPAEKEIWSFGSGYGGNSILGKECFALRMASVMGRSEGWLAQHMSVWENLRTCPLIIERIYFFSITDPRGREKYLAAAFPSGCGKTNLALLEPSIPGWKIQCVADDVVWMRFDKNGRLIGINPEAGFFGLAPGTSQRTNRVAMETVSRNCIFTNIARTANGEFFWEGLEHEIEDKNVEITSWLSKPWKIGSKRRAAHRESRFVVPATQCPIMHPEWDSRTGLPIDAILFGGRRPQGIREYKGVPLVYESFSWVHGVFIGASLKTTAHHSGESVLVHDPMAMCQFISYNFGKYLQHWIDISKPHKEKLPRIYHVNWFRLDENGEHLWPGFRENIRVLEWICRRLDGEEVGEETDIGIIPTKGSVNLEGLEDLDWSGLFSFSKKYWMDEVKDARQFLEEQAGSDLPVEILEEIKKLEDRIQN